jgi:helix-turn-helix resolvase-like protein
MEVNVLRERTIKGIEAARARGVNGGRPAGSYNKKKASAVVTLYKQKNSITFIEETQNISRSTIYRYLRKEGIEVKGFIKIKNKKKYIVMIKSKLPAEEEEQKKRVIQKNRNCILSRRKIVLSRLIMIQRR